MQELRFTTRPGFPLDDDDFLGAGADATEYGQSNYAFRLKDNFAGQYYNSVFHDFEGKALRIDDASTLERANTAGDLYFENNTWGSFGASDGSVESLTKNSHPEEIAILNSNGNEVADPAIVSRKDPRPTNGSSLWTAARTALPADDDFFVEANYRGAFGEDNWLKGWTYLDAKGLVDDSEVITAPAGGVVAGNITTDTTWSASNEYILDKPIFVTDGATLTIEAGTTIYGTENLDAGTFGSLIVTRGSKINAVGTAEEPIVFTALDAKTADLTLDDTSLWGGIIILGKAILNDAGNPFLGGDTLNERVIEGFPSGGNDDLVSYGGLDDKDNSGELKYVSIRYGGYEFAANNEINGLTLGAVGSGTKISYVEVYNNSDDGIEFFGGTVDTHHMVMAFNEDESFDIDQGYRGRGQFWFAIQKDGGADGTGTGSNYGGEHDGGDSPTKTLEPFARVKVYNATWLGAGADATEYGQSNYAFRLKDNFAGQYYNSVFHDFEGKALRIDDASTLERANTAGDLYFENNTWGSFGASDGSVESLTKNSHPEEIAILNSNGNEVADPAIVSRKDPRPTNGSSLWTAARTALPADDDFFVEANYRGAFGEDNWLKGWTYLDAKGLVDDSEVITAPAGISNLSVSSYSYNLATGDLNISWVSEAGKSYGLEYSLDLKTWTDLEVTVDADGSSAVYSILGNQNPLLGQSDVFLRVYEK